MAQAPVQSEFLDLAEVAVPPRLTRLELIGFKSFASRTVFQFERGITAIIGPNGSGKSNIADAVRWALGETSYSNLRGKKTEDVIFAGGQGRAPAGMAEVTLTFDNETGWLPIEFREVTVTRRAFRSGETAYLINGRKVRLKDVHQLTASLGHSYTVVGQGLVDSALSQRAEDRRGLFEHAADLAGLRLKAVESERNLAEAEGNIARLTDILSEVEPRLRSLERAARQANEYRDVRDRLRTLQRAHFRRLLLDVSERLTAIESTAASGREMAETLQVRHDELTSELARIRAHRETSADLLDRHKVGLAESTEQHRRVVHQRELSAERLTALHRRRDDLDETQRGLEQQIVTVESELIAVRTHLETVDSDLAGARVRLQEVEAILSSERDARAAAEAEQVRLTALVTDRERQIADTGRRKALLLQRAETDGAERERIDAGARDRAGRLQKIDADIVSLNQLEETAGFRMQSIDAGVIEFTTTQNQLQTEQKTAAETVSKAERNVARLTAQLREMTRLHESGAGLFAGVRAVLKASREKSLTGIRGTIAELITVPPTYDTALEVALASHLQDIVTEKWTHAEAAIAHLKQNNLGRATFQPIDTVRGKRTPASVLSDVTGLKGVYGVAADLIETPADLDGIVTALLGRSLIVEDLAVARASLPHLPSGWNAITLSGEVVRTSGSVTGGTAVKESGALARERELRELPDQVKQAESKVLEASTALDEIGSKIRAASERRQQLESERAALLATRRERESQRTRLNGWLADLRRDEAGVINRLAALEAGAAEYADQIDGLDAEIVRLSGERDGARAALDALLQTAPATDRSTTSPTDLAFREAERQVAAISERQGSERRRETQLAAQLQHLLDEKTIRGERSATVVGEIEAVEAELTRLDGEVAVLAESIEIATQDLEPLVEEHDATVEQAGKLELQLERERERLIEAERDRGHSGVVVERIRGEQIALHQRIFDDLEMEKPEDLLDGEIEESPVADPDEAEREIVRLKERLRRVGYAGDNAVEDYETERERHAFLRDQLADVEGAAASIRTMLDDVRSTMQERFQETFSRVAMVFSETFATLFGGGQARLILVQDEDGAQTGGIDIVAQPPGKRLQSLALLSGGERALTGVALLFAILKVNPTPFCLLDEVDAALDEANVVRFRDQLQHLAAETQSIIITHNRGTIESANTLYGVSMKDDGTSTVLSLRLTDVVLAD